MFLDQVGGMVQLCELALNIKRFYCTLLSY